MKEVIQKLREVTGAGIMDCKRALEETAGDFDKAVALLHEQGLAKADKKSTRATGSGLLESYIHNERVGVLLELRCETDFAARSEPFRLLSKELAMQIAAMDPQTPEELLRQSYIRDESKAIGEVIKQVIAKVGENIKVERFIRYEL